MTKGNNAGTKWQKTHKQQI